MAEIKFEHHELILEVINIAGSFELKVEEKELNRITVWANHYTGLQLRFWIEQDRSIYFDFHTRTYSHFYNGERTDLHDIISIMFSAFLKNSQICSFLFVDVDNPAVYIEGEIYGRFMIPDQVDPGLIHSEHVDPTKLTMLVASLAIFNDMIWTVFCGCPCDACRKRLGYTFDYRWRDIEPGKLDNLKAIFSTKEKKYNYNERTLPTWFYYKDFRKRLMLIESEGFAEFLKASQQDIGKVNNGITGQLIVQGHFQHFLKTSLKKKIEIYFKDLKDSIIAWVFFDSKLLASGDRHIIVVDAACGYNDFRTEKQNLWERHQREFNDLFQPSNLKWAEKISDSLFENLIKELLEREPNVVRVRKLAHTNEPDGGTDLIAEWRVPKDYRTINKYEEPYEILNVIVQCKAYKNGVGKSDVLDIRDTVENRDYDGFFLAVSSYTKKNLTNHLDKIRLNGKIWIDWWTSAEIEERLKANEDLITKYQTIVTFEKM